MNEIFKLAKPLKKKFRFHKDQYINIVIPIVDFREIIHCSPDIITIDLINKISTICNGFLFISLSTKHLLRGKFDIYHCVIS